MQSVELYVDLPRPFAFVTYLAPNNPRGEHSGWENCETWKREGRLVSIGRYVQLQTWGARGTKALGTPWSAMKLLGFMALQVTPSMAPSMAKGNSRHVFSDHQRRCGGTAWLL